MMHNKHGYTTPILIYCREVEKGLNNAKHRSVNKDHLYKITKYEKDVLQYARFDS